MTPSSLPLFDQPSPQESSAPKCFTIAESVALYGPESLSDAQIIEAMLNRARPGRAEEILLQAESLGRLVAMGPSELQALGLTKAEMARFAVLQEVQRRSTRSFDRPRITSPRSRGCLPPAQGPGLDRGAFRDAGPQRQGRSPRRPDSGPRNRHRLPHQPPGVLPGSPPLRCHHRPGLAQPSLAAIPLRPAKTFSSPTVSAPLVRASASPSPITSLLGTPTIASAQPRVGTGYNRPSRDSRGSA